MLVYCLPEEQRALNMKHMTYTQENVYKMTFTGLSNTYGLLASRRESKLDITFEGKFSTLN